MTINDRKDILGFTHGYVTIFAGDCDLRSHEEWFKASTARYNKYWGWHFISTDPIPPDYPQELTPVHLRWEDVLTAFATPDAETAITTLINQLRAPYSTGTFVGRVGERLENDFTIAKTIIHNGKFIYIMKDPADNTYVWFTSAKALTEGATYHMRGTVKEHKIYNNTKQTILTRCSLRA